MIQYKKIIMTLALLLAAVGGAWADGNISLKELTADMLPSNWQENYDTPVTTTDMLGFTATTLDEAKAHGAPSNTGTVWIIYGVDTDGYFKVFYYRDGTYQGEAFVVDFATVYSDIKTFGHEVYYTAANVSILTEVTPGKEWKIESMPAYNVTLMVEYYGEPELAWTDKEQNTVTAISGYHGFPNTFTVPKLKMNEDFKSALDDEKSSIRFTSSDESVFKADSSAVFELNGVGEAIISAVHDTDEDFYYDSTAYRVTVLAPDTITFRTNNADWGTLEQVSENDSIIEFPTMLTVPGAKYTVQATPAAGYHLRSWSNGAAVNSTLTIEGIVAGNADILAFFAPDTVPAIITENPMVYDTLVYNGVAQTILANGMAEGGVFKYSMDSVSWATELPAIKDAGTYTFYCYVDSTDVLHRALPVQTLTVDIAKAQLNITANDTTVIYGNTAPAFTATYEGWQNTDDEAVVSGLTISSAYTVTSNVGTYDIVPANATATNYDITFVNGTLTVNQASLTVTANDTTVIYGDEAPAFTATYEGWKNSDDETVVSNLAYTCEYEPGSHVGTYAINPNSATATNYAITFVDGTLTVNRDTVFTTSAEAQIAKFEDGTTDAVVLNAGILNGIKLNDAIGITTTAAFGDAAVGENKTITLYYELTGDAELLENYELYPTSENFTDEAVIIEQMIPDESAATEEEAENKEGIEVYAYGYCDGGYSLRYHLRSGNPDQYKIEFEDSRFEDVDWTDLTTAGKDGTIDIDIPEDLPTGDYSMTITFRDSRFTWLESDPITVSFHVNLPKTYTAVLFDNVISLVNTCNCLTEVQWYHRDSSDDTWEAISGANGYYYRQVGGLTGEYFVSVKMNEVATYTCPQTDVETLYGDGSKIVRVNVAPNPIVDNATVTIEGSDKLTHSLSIINLMGAEMEYRTFEGDSTTVEMGGYTSGNYMISVDGVAVKVIRK